LSKAEIALIASMTVEGPPVEPTAETMSSLLVKPLPTLR